MKKNEYLPVGGLVAMGFDGTGRYLLTVTHSGRGVFETGSWDRVARDTDLAYPDRGVSAGIGPIEGQRIPVIERDEKNEQIRLQSPDGKLELIGESDGITIRKI